MKILNKKQLGMLALSVLALGSVGYSVNAYQGDYSQKGPNYSKERHNNMTKAFTENNYNAWKELMNGRGRVTEVINESNFAQFAEAHRLGSAGDVEGARAIRSELGLQNGNGEKMGSGYGRGNGENRMNK